MTLGDLPNETSDITFIIKIKKSEVNKLDPKIWYLPHFGVINPNKPKKIRIVFDAASKSNGQSLNDSLLSGPDLFSSLISLLLNFRINNIAFVADIKEMFLQINIRKEDQCAQRLLWREMRRSGTPDVYQIQVVFFGSVCGPTLAQEVRKTNGIGIAIVIESIEHNLLSDGAKYMHFNSTLASEKILGLWWNPRKDNFSFQTSFHKVDKDVLNNKKKPTKREVLKIVMAIFDPLGFLGNFLIHGKILLQDIWRSGIKWDEKINDDQKFRWDKFLKDLHSIEDYTIPRQYFTFQPQVTEIHIFCDASENAMAAVAYLRVIYNSQYYVSFYSKTKVAPLKYMSIPRLELQAALIGARIGNFLRNERNKN